MDRGKAPTMTARQWMFASLALQVLAFALA